MAMLEGVRVLDMGWVLGGPFAGQLLAQMGADVVKIESLDGDLARAVPPHFADGESSFFLSVNRGKRSVAIDLKQDSGRAAFDELVRHSDAVIHNFAPDVPKRLGVDLQTLKAINPKICVGQLIGFHDEGEYRSTPAFDLVIQAQAGFMSLTGERDGKPVRAGYQVADLAGGLYLALGLVGALFGASRSGVGQEIQVSLFDCQVALLTWQAQNYFISGEVPRRNGSRHHMIAPSEVFSGSDGKYFVISPTGDAFFKKFSSAVGHPELAEDDRFATGAGRIAHVDVLAKTLQSIFSTKSAADWVERLKAERIPAGALNEVDEALDHEVTALRSMVETLVNPATGNSLSFLGNPLKWSSDRTLSYPPRLGEHTGAVLAEVCGYDAARIEELARTGAIVTG
ncbi:MULTISPECIES: CoA transferase [Rhodopseudomonas]|nr:MULTISPECIES: CoA transferase [Rhodopseudomonas]MDF3813734.1 CoA transferase [Rhodopseudomonas sp. BAL398]WOK17622.1 CoA transferase [Rhodopseudomonas sp. BAL398]